MNTVPQAVDQLERRVTQLRDHMDEPIVEFLQIPPAYVNLLPRAVTQFITKSKEPGETTFADFVSGSGSGLQGRRGKTVKECAVRIAAARIHKWLERLVLIVPVFR
jgi:hypothetical protein